MSDNQISSVRRLFEECFNTGNMVLADELVASNYVDYSTLVAPSPGVEGFKQRIASLRKTFPDARFSVDDIFDSGDRVAFRWTMKGTDTGGFMGRPATGKTISVTGINIEHLVNGKIVEHWSAPDNLSMMRQLGMIP